MPRTHFSLSRDKARQGGSQRIMQHPSIFHLLFDFIPLFARFQNLWHLRHNLGEWQVWRLMRTTHLLLDRVNLVDAFKHVLVCHRANTDAIKRKFLLFVSVVRLSLLIVALVLLLAEHLEML